MPFHAKRYPANWKEISQRIRQRAQQRCEFCGAQNYAPHPVTGSKVVLTVAHLDHDTTHNSDDNLKALCQRCHLAYDAKMHAVNSAKTRKQKRIANGQMELL